MRLKLLALLLLTTSPLTYAWQTNVTIQGGKIEGYIDSQTNIWQGIPYASPPVGELRWKAPQPPKAWDGVKETKKSTAFLQPSSQGVTGTEDSLNVDVYRPNTNEKNLPVLVYIHGGNNQGGRADELMGQSFVNKLNVVLVSVNYRLGVLGFNPLPSINKGSKDEQSGNYALLDMASSLDWVKNNIQTFGGNANNITISGFSAGGRDVMAMLISPIFKGKFDKAISYSGGMTLASKPESAKVFAKAIAPLVVEDKVKPDLATASQWLLQDTKEVRDYLYKVNSKRLAPLMGAAGIRMAVFPHLYTDGHVLPKEGYNTSHYNDVPLMMLTGTNEFASFAGWDPMFSGKLDTADPILWAKYKFASRYGSAFYRLFNVEDSAEKMTSHYQASIYSVEVNFGNDAIVVGDKMATVGAYHGVWLPLLARDKQNLGSYSQRAFDLKGTQQLSQAFQTYMKSFLYNGKPQGSGLPTWSAWNDKNKPNQHLVLDANQDQTIIYSQSKAFTHENIIEQMQKDKSLSLEQKQEVISKVLNGRWFSDPIDRAFKNPSLWP